MLWRVNPSSPTPLFELVAASVRRAIADGTLQPKERLPSAKEVAAALDINMHTVLRAYQLLRDEGLIELRKGRGAVVLATTPGFSRLSDLITQTLAESNRLGIPLDDLVHMFRERTASR